MNTKRTRLLRWSPLAVLAILMLWGIKHWAFAAPPTKLLTVPVQVGDVEQTVLASGIIQPRKLVSVGAQASGRILAMHVALGDHVTKGQLIAEIDPATQKNALDNAEAVLTQERAQRASREVARKLADLAFRRAKVTYSEDASSQADYETAQATYDGAKADIIALDAQIKQAAIAVDTARVTLGFTKVLAPMDGTVVAIVAPEGQTVNAVQAAPTIVKLADLETMTVKAQISEADVTRVHAGQKVYFTILGAPQHRYYASLRAVEPAPESLAVETAGAPAGTGSGSGAQNSAIYYSALFEIANHDHSLRPSMTAEVSVVLNEAKQVATLPTSALGEARPDGRRMVRVDDGKGSFQERWIQVGIDDSSVVQVIDGVKPGDQIVLSAAPAPEARASAGAVQITMATDGLSRSILLEMSAVGREFRSGDGTFAALKDIDLRIGEAEMLAVIGASGSGKSTLMNILGCLDRPTSGTYRIAGVDVASLDADGFSALRRERFGFIFQRYNLLPDLTALENVEVPAVYLGLPKAERHDRAANLLGRLELRERMNHRPGQLSGGQQQRVSIARALMNGGGIILADEPTGALDSRVGEEVLSVLRQLHAEGHTVILVTHDPNVAAHADRVIEIKDGRLVSDRRRAVAQATPVTVAKPDHATGIRKGATVVSDFWGRLSEALRMAVLAMNANRLRTFLTMLGIIIGIASVASVVALGQGGQQRILSMIRGIGTNTIDIYPGSGWGDLKAASVETLTPYDADSISRQGHIDSVTPTVTTTASVRFSGQSVSGTINGVGADFFRVHNMQIAEGKLFSPADVAALAQVVVIDENTRKKLFPITEIPVGHIVFLGPVPFRVVGIARPATGVFPDPNLNVWAPYTAVMGRISGQRHLKGITARFSDDSPSAVVESLITRLLLLRHGRHDFYMNNTDTIRISVQAATDTMTHVVLSIALVSLVVGGIGVMNIMLVSVTERTREIGIRMAVGARRLDILWQFVIEAVLVCIIGGLLGVVLAFATSFVLPRFFPTYPMIFSVGSVVAAVTVSTLTGVLFGFIPARNAARLDPVEALARD